MTRRRIWLASLGILATLGTAAADEPWSPAALDAAQQYEAGEFAVAAEGYRGVIDSGDPRPQLTYNLGNSLYRTGAENPAHLEEALNAYRQAVAAGDPTLRPAALYNSANTLFHMEQLPQAEALYREALRQDPHDAEARYNLELVQRLLENEQSQGQEGGEDEEQQQGEPNPEDESQSEQNQGGEQNEQNEDGGQEQEPQESESPPDEGQPPPEPQDGEPDPSQDGAETPEPDPSQSPPPEEQPGEPRPARISPEEARRQLDKLEEEEREIMRQLLEARRERLNVEKDW